MAKVDWPFATPEVFCAVDGNLVGVPLGWSMGSGTWGCLQSHRTVLQDALMDGVRRLLVLEDDLCMRSTFVEEAERFLQEVPDDWDQLMVGGQHIGPTRQVKNGIVKCTNTQRTHAYAIRNRSASSKMLSDLYALWCSHTSQTHCDHIMGPMQSRYNVYAPTPFLFGQSKSVSDISGARNPTKFWQPPTGNEPILLLKCSQMVVSKLRDWGVHTGYTRDPATDVDQGLSKCFNPYNQAKLVKWINDLQWECVSEENTVLGVWHPDATLEQLSRIWAGPVTEICADTVEEALLRLPDAKRKPLPAREYVILFKGDRQTIGQLRSLGWHTGNWRDPITDQDNGLREWALDKRPDRLREVVQTLVTEAEGVRNGVACLWHPELTEDVVSNITNLRVVTVDAEDSNGALRQWSKATGVTSKSGE